MRVVVQFLLVTAFYSAAAIAQLKPETHTGSIVATNPQTVESKTARIIRKNFARCAFRKSRKSAIALLENSDTLAVDLNGAKIANLSKTFELDDCLGEEVSATEYALGLNLRSTDFRDLMAEEAYLEANRTAPLVPVPTPTLHTRFVSVGTALELAKGLTSFVDCTILQNVTGADSLLRTEPGSNQERLAARALASVMGQCLHAGQDAKFNPAGIRSMIAFGMWSRFGRRADVK